MQHTRLLATPIVQSMRWQCQRLLILCLVLMLPACAQQSLRRKAPLPATMQGQELHGILADMRTLQPLDLRMLAHTLAKSQVIFVGEEHDHPAIQAFELRLLQTLAQQRPQRIALAMEFLKRDDQQTVDAYLHKRIDQATLYKRLKASPSFRRHYAPLVHYARRAGLPVIAMNIPRRIVRQVARTGLQATLQRLSATERAYLPTSIPSVPDRYRQYFLAAVPPNHPIQGEETHFTQAAFLKDATMATSLATFLRRHPNFTVIAIAGRFHVDYGIALPSLLSTQYAQVNMHSITTMTVTADKAINLSELKHEAIADYIRFFPPMPTHDTASTHSLTEQETATNWQEATKVGGNQQDGQRSDTAGPYLSKLSKRQ